MIAVPYPRGSVGGEKKALDSVPSSDFVATFASFLPKELGSFKHFQTSTKMHACASEAGWEGHLNLRVQVQLGQHRLYLKRKQIKREILISLS